MKTSQVVFEFAPLVVTTAVPANQVCQILADTYRDLDNRTLETFTLPLTEVS